jgi:hypothetical protein
MGEVIRAGAVMIALLTTKKSERDRRKAAGRKGEKR